MGTVCQIGTEKVKTADWKHAKTQVNKFSCVCNDVVYASLFKNPEFEQQPIYIMRNCVHNEDIGLHNRYLKETPNTVTYDENIFQQCLSDLVFELKKHWHGPMSLAEFMSEKKGRLRKRYDDAAKDVLKYGFNARKDSTITAFVKNEIYNELKPPRMIMGRNPKFNLIYGLFTTALEHCMVKIPQFSKGKNFIERGKQFEELIFGSWIMEGDFSKFEATQRKKLLEDVELGIWSKLLNDKDYELIRILFYMKMLKKGHTLNGLNFEFSWCRGSGDMDTGLFNSIISWIACRYFCIVNDINKESFTVDGDDNLIKIPQGMDNTINTFSLFGLDAKLILRKNYYDADYCSGKFIQYKPGKFIYVQNIRKIMNNVRIFRKTKFKHAKGDYYYSLGYMYNIMYPNFPLYSNLAKCLMRIVSLSSKRKRYINTTVLNELNPSYMDYIARIDNDWSLDVDMNNLKLEICMAFKMSLTEMDYYSESYDRFHLILDKEEDQRLRSEGKVGTRLTHAELGTVEGLIHSSVLNFGIGNALDRCNYFSIASRR